MRRLLPLLLPWAFLAGCAVSQVPQTIRQEPVQPLSVPAVQREPERFLGRQVRWGGTIIAVRNRERITEIEILSRPLDADGEPRGEETGEGRFIASLAGFADPAELPDKRLLTVAGRLTRVETRPVGQYPYVYPVVQVESRYLWPEPLALPPPYYYYDPWYDPWNRPWYRPWYPRYRHRHH